MLDLERYAVNIPYIFALCHLALYSMQIAEQYADKIVRRLNCPIFSATIARAIVSFERAIESF